VTATGGHEDLVTLQLPRRDVRELERALKTGVIRLALRDGGRPSPVTARIIRQLHAAAGAPTADVGSEDHQQPTVEITVDAVAAVLGCRPRWIRTLLESGRLRGRRVNARMWLVDAASVDEYRFGRTSGQSRTTPREAAGDGR
jgi:excisionase family DNA binding protein